MSLAGMLARAIKINIWSKSPVGDIDPKDYLTIPKAMKRLKMPRRSLYRVMERLGIDKVSKVVFGRRVIHVTMLEAIKAEHAPMGSDRRHEIAVMYGAMGGETKALNRARRARRDADRGGDEDNRDR